MKGFAIVTLKPEDDEARPIDNGNGFALVFEHEESAKKWIDETPRSGYKLLFGDADEQPVDDSTSDSKRNAYYIDLSKLEADYDVT